MPQKILLAGAAGFIGSNFVHYSREHHPEDTLVILDKLTYAGNRDNIGALIRAGEVAFFEGDIADGELVDSLCKKEQFTMVINFAAETHVDRSIIEPGIFVMTNIVGTHNLLSAALKHGVSRYHQISTDEVYGDLGEGSTDFFTEHTPLNPNCPYAASKAAADLLVASYFKTYGFPATISRCTNNYGPYQFPEKLIPFFFQLASQGLLLPLYGDGNNVRDWLYVIDHCEAIDVILRRGRPGEIYNVGGHNERKNREIAEMILAFLGKPASLIRYVEDRKAHDRRYAMDPRKIETELGWRPKTTFAEGIKKTFDWYEANRPWWQKIIDRHSVDSSRTHLSRSRPTSKRNTLNPIP